MNKVSRSPTSLRVSGRTCDLGLFHAPSTVHGLCVRSNDILVEVTLTAFAMRL